MIWRKKCIKKTEISVELELNVLRWFLRSWSNRRKKRKAISPLTDRNEMEVNTTKADFIGTFIFQWNQSDALSVHVKFHLVRKCFLWWQHKKQFEMLLQRRIKWNKSTGLLNSHSLLYFVCYLRVFGLFRSPHFIFT